MCYASRYSASINIDPDLRPSPRLSNQPLDRFARRRLIVRACGQHPRCVHAGIHCAANLLQLAAPSLKRAADEPPLTELNATGLVTDGVVAPVESETVKRMSLHSDVVFW